MMHYLRFVGTDDGHDYFEIGHYNPNGVWDAGITGIPSTEREEAVAYVSQLNGGHVTIIEAPPGLELVGPESLLSSERSN